MSGKGKGKGGRGDRKKAVSRSEKAGLTFPRAPAFSGTLVPSAEVAYTALGCASRVMQCHDGHCSAKDTRAEASGGDVLCNTCELSG